MFEHRLHLSKIGHTFLNGVSLSDLIWTYVVAGAYCLVQGRVWRFHQRNKDRLDPLSSTLKMRVGKKTGRIHENLWCTPWGVSWKSAATAHIPGGFSAFETDIEFVHSFVYICLRSQIRKTVLTRSQGDFKLKPPLGFKRWCHGNPSLQSPSQSQSLF